DTISCLKSIFIHCENPDLFITVVDNCSQNESVKNLDSFLRDTGSVFQLLTEGDEIVEPKCRIHIIQAKENHGYAKGNNLGIKFLLEQQVEFIIVLNNDILFKKDIIPSLQKVLIDNPNIRNASPL